MTPSRQIALGLTALAAAAGLLRAAGARVPAGIRPVRGFEVKRYLGRWYEIARLDHRFERGLTAVSASYGLNDDGTVRVVNRGRRPDGRWKMAVGTARFREDPTLASLAVTFRWPFAGGYHVFALDPDYRWAVVSGPTRGYLWILARDRHPAPEVYAMLVDRARRAGFDTEALIRVDQSSQAGDA